MLKLFLRTTVITLVLVFIASAVASAQPYGDRQGKGPKAREKMSAMKKVKLLEVLDLDEAASNKFLAKYTTWENKIEAHRTKIRDAFIDLEKALKNNEDKNVIKEKTDKVLDLQNQMIQLMQDARNDIKTILNDTQFAKYVLFEHKFTRELKKMIMKHMHGRKKGAGKFDN